MKETERKEHAVELSANQKLAIQQEVERRLEKLPAGTYQLIEEMVQKRVASAEKWYRWVGIILAVCITFSASVFYKATANNAAEVVAKEIGSSEVRKKADEMERLLRNAQDTTKRLTVSAEEGMNAGNALKTRLAQLEGIDNVVRYSESGSLDLRCPVVLHGKETTNFLTMYFDPNGTFRFFDGKKWFAIMDGSWIQADVPK